MELKNCQFDANNNNALNSSPFPIKDHVISLNKENSSRSHVNSQNGPVHGTLNVRGSQSSEYKIGRGTSRKDEDLMYFAAENFTTEDLLTSGGRASVHVNDKDVALICHDNVVYAVQEKCPHYGGPLHLGDIEEVPGCGPHIKCPWHSWTFSLTTGKCISPRDRELAGNLETFPVRFNSKKNTIKIGFSEFSPTVFKVAPE